MSHWHTNLDGWDQPAAREEEEEDSEGTINDLNEGDGGHTEAGAQAALDASGTQGAIQVLLDSLCHSHALVDESPPTSADSALDLLCNHAALLKALERLRLQSQDKTLDVIFWACISAMVGVLNLFLDLDLQYTWREASMIVTKAQGHGTMHVCSIWTWVLNSVQEGRLPFHLYGYTCQTVLEDKDVLQQIQEDLSEKSKASFINAQDVCDIVASEKIQDLFLWLGIHKPSISISTAHRWLAKLKWCYSKVKNGMYIDGHKRDDVMAYWQDFVNRWAEYEIQFQIWDNSGNPLPRLSDFHPLLILVIHDELVFFQNDERKTCWNHQDS
jgi:hypothetical protein